MLTIFGDIHPYGIIVKCILVGVEALERVLIPRVLPVHGGIVLMAKDNARARYAFSGGFCALSADRLLLIALQLSLAASETVQQSQEAISA